MTNNSVVNNNNNNKLVTDLPFIRVYKDGTVERLDEDPPHVPPSPSDPITGVSSKDIFISPHIPARIYLPAPSTATAPSGYNKLPVLVYYHGGGFCLNSAFSTNHHPYLNSLVSSCNCIAISVEYRLAPEHPLPTAYEDSWEALNWVASHSLKSTGHPPLPNADPWITEYGNFEKLYIGGDSAGGNIVHNMVVRVVKEKLVDGGVEILGGFLSHPYFLDDVSKDEDQLESIPVKVWKIVYPDAPGGVENHMIKPWVEGGPGLSELGCKKMMVVVAEKDEVRAAGVKYCEKVRESGWGGTLELVDVEGEDHCFHFYNPETDKAKYVVRRLAAFIS